MNVEQELRARLRGVGLVLEIGLDGATVQRARDVIEAVAPNVEDLEDTLAEVLPATIATYLVALGIDSYDGAFWPHQPIPGLDQNKLGRAFERALQSLGLETFEHLDQGDRGLRYITPILAHGGIPKYSTRDYLRLVVDELRRHPGATADELVALWRTRRTAFTNIDTPVRRFITYGGGVAVDFLDRTIELIRTPPSEARPELAALLGLPEHIVTEYASFSSKNGPRAGVSEVARLPRPAIRFDPWSGTGPVAELPAVGSSHRNGSWSVAGDGHTRMLEASAIESRMVALEPAASWEIGFDDGTGAGRSYAFECLGESPVVCFEPGSGAYVPDTRPIALDELWVVHPENAHFTAINGSGEQVQVPVCAELPRPAGSWTGFVARHLDLSGIRAIRCLLETPGALPVESWIRVMRPSDRPAIVGNQVADVSGELGEVVFSDLPVLRVPVVPGFGDERWYVTVKGPWLDFQGTIADIGRAGESVALPRAAGSMAGVVEVSLRGPLGSDLRARFGVVSGLRVVTPTKVLLPADREPKFVEVHASNDILIDGGDADGARIAVPANGTELSLVASAPGSSAGIRVRLPRVQWAEKRRGGLPVLQAQRLRIDRDDLDSGMSESIVVSTNRGGTPLSLELWGEDGPRKVTPEVLASPGDGRWVFDLAEFRDTVRLELLPRLWLQLRLGGDSVTLADIVANVGATEFTSRAAELDEIDEFDEFGGAISATVIDYHQARELRSRVALLWSLDRPWAAAVSVPIPDGAPSSFVVSAADAPPGNYRVQIAVDDGWSTASRPRRDAPNSADLALGTWPERIEHQRDLRAKGALGLLEIAATSGSRPEELVDQLSAEIAELAFEGAVSNTADDPNAEVSKSTRVLAAIAFSDPPALARAVSRLFAEERVDRSTLLLVLLVALQDALVLDCEGVSDQVLRATWQGCPPMAGLFDVKGAECGNPEAADRCEQFLEWRPGQPVDTRSGNTLTELELSRAQLRSLQLGLGLIPRGILTWDNWALASFEWLSLRGEGRLRDWWRKYEWLAGSEHASSAIQEAVDRRVPARHPDSSSAFPRAILSAAAHVVTGDEDRAPAAEGLLAAVRIGAGRLVVHDLCLAEVILGHGVGDVTATSTWVADQE